MSVRMRVYSKKLWVLACLALVAVAAVIISGATRTGTQWICNPVDPEQRSRAVNPCFRVVLRNSNRLSLEWRVAAHARTVHIYDDTAPNYADIGPVPRVCDSGPEGGCAVSLAVVSAGTYRWILGVTGHGGNQVHINAEISVPPPPVQVELTGGGHIDPFAPASQEFSWRVDTDVADTGGWVELQRPSSSGWSRTRFPLSGDGARFTVPATEFNSPGDVVFRLRACRLPEGSNLKFCSPAHGIGYKVEYDKFSRDRYLYATSGQDLEIAFSNHAGNFRLLSSATLLPQGGAIAVPGSSFVVNGEFLTPGIHRLELDSCRLQESLCSNRTPADPASTAGMLYQLPPGHYLAGDMIAVVIADGGSYLQKIYAPVTGDVFFEQDTSIRYVEPGTPIAYSISASSDVLTVFVDSPVQWVLDRDYREDFKPGVGYNLSGFGEPLDTVFDDRGGIWAVNEFSNNVEHIDKDGQVLSLNVPLARQSQAYSADDNASKPLRLVNQAVKPFGFWGPDLFVGRTSVSTLVERVANIDSRIWVSQGGGFHTAAQAPLQNHSRIVSYDPARTEDLSTRYNDSFCVFNVPADDPLGFGNNQVIGLAGARGRIWIAESRGLFNDEPSLISSFIPHPELCENLLDFDNPTALPAQDLQYCGPDRNPDQDSCMSRLVLDELPRNIKVAHLQADPVDETLWFTDASGQCLGHIDPDREAVTSIYRFPDTHEKSAASSLGLGGFPWSLVVDRDAVYVGEYSSRQILRYDKRTSTFHEISVPHSSHELKLHSLALDTLHDRLWFTLANEHEVTAAGSNSTIGYIDLASWRSHLDTPGRAPRINGTVYGGLETIPASPLHPGMPQAFRGIAFDATTGRLAIATMFRQQLTVLTPHPGFWP